MDSLVVLLSLITGVVLGWLAHSKVSRAELEAQKLSADQMKESFAAVAQDSLAKNNQQFLDLAKSNFEKIHISADKDLQNRQQAIQNFANNLQQNLLGNPNCYSNLHPLECSQVKLFYFFS